jgi:hypothetical protein
MMCGRRSLPAFAESTAFMDRDGGVFTVPLTVDACRAAVVQEPAGNPGRLRASDSEEPTPKRRLPRGL